jgi:hypothetical protein
MFFERRCTIMAVLYRCYIGPDACCQAHEGVKAEQRLAGGEVIILNAWIEDCSPARHVRLRYLGHDRIALPLCHVG